MGRRATIADQVAMGAKTRRNVSVLVGDNEEFCRAQSALFFMFEIGEEGTERAKCGANRTIGKGEMVRLP